MIPLPWTPEENRERQEAHLLGESLIRKSQVAVLIVAGGQSTRLGFPGPKGKFPVSPVRQKPLFQLFAESVRAISARYRATIPLLIMTSEENREETQDFFAAHQFFGMDSSTVFFFTQAMLPTLAPDGKLLLKDPCHLLTNPDGHGGSLKAFHASGLLAHLMARGVSELFYCQVDNPLVKIADPAFIGTHRRMGAEISTKIVRRHNLEEKVGIYAVIHGKPAIIEYSDFRPEEYRSVDERGNLRHWAANIAVHVISLPFIERLNRHGFALPIHRAIKDVYALGKDGRTVKMKGWKFETFVFDAIPLAQKACCLEVRREEEFSPIKNQTGIDSPDTAREAMNALYRGWLQEAGVEVERGVNVEISPLFALDKKELIQRLKGKKLDFKEDIYLG